MSCYVTVTRGDVDLEEIRKSLQPYILQVWDNSRSAVDFGPFGAFVLSAQIYKQISPPCVHYQDDDCVVDWPSISVMWWGVNDIVLNVPKEFRKQYEGEPITLMGFGSVFSSSLIRPTFDRYLKYFSMDALFFRECTRIFTGLNQDRIVLADVPKRDLPWATASNRLYKQADHIACKKEIMRRVAYVLEQENGEKI